MQRHFLIFLVLIGICESFDPVRAVFERHRHGQGAYYPRPAGSYYHKEDWPGSLKVKRSYNLAPGQRLLTSSYVSKNFPGVGNHATRNLYRPSFSYSTQHESLFHNPYHEAPHLHQPYRGRIDPKNPRPSNRRKQIHPWPKYKREYFPRIYHHKVNPKAFDTPFH